jgi:hypothetical protein
MQAEAVPLKLDEGSDESNKSNEHSELYFLPWAISSRFISWIEVIKQCLVDDKVSSTKTDEEQDLGDRIIDTRPSRVDQCFKRLRKSPKAFEFHVNICNKIAGKCCLFTLETAQGVQFATGPPSV